MQNRGSGAGSRARDWLAHALIAVLVAFFFREILSRTAFFWEDFLYQYYAFRTFAATSLASGHLPLWNPYTFNGMPFQADIQSAIFYVPNLLLTAFAFDGTLDYWLVELSVVLHFVLAGSGMYLLARSYGLDRLPALFSAVAYAFSGFLVGHLIHQGFIYQAAWLPLVFHFFRKALGERSWRAAIIAGLLLGHALLAGAPQITLYIVLFLFLYTLFQSGLALRSSGAKGALGLAPFAALPIVIALLSTAVQLLPTAELAPLSQRAEISYEKAATGSFGPEQLINLAVPKYFGSNTAGGSTWQGTGEYWQYWETQAYIGVLALLFAVVAVVTLRRTPEVWFLAGAIVFAFLYALGDHFVLFKLFYNFVPGFETFRVPGRMVLWFCFGGSILAGMGLQRLLSTAAEKPALARTVALSAAAGAVVLAVAGQTAVFLPALPGQTPEAATEAARVAGIESLKSAAFLVVAGVLLFGLSRKLLSAATFAVLALVIQFTDIHLASFEQNNGPLDPDAYFAANASLSKYFRDKGKEEFFRVNSRQEGAMLLDRNQGMIDRIFLMEGYTPLGLARFIPPMSSWSRTCDLMNAKYRIAVDFTQGTMEMVEVRGYHPRAFIVARAAVAASADEAKAMISDPAFDPRSLVIFEEAPPAQPAGEGGADSLSPSATITSYELNAIQVTTESPTAGYLVLSEVWYPGWRATVDGAEAPVLRADWCLRAIPVPAGKHAVTLEFSPSSFHTGAWISSITLVFAAAGIVLTRKKENA